MYVTSSNACNLPNSASPLPDSAITDQDAYIAAVGASFDNGDAALDDLISQLGGTIPSDADGDQGIPTVGTGPLVTNPSDTGGTPVGPSGVPWIMQTTPQGVPIATGSVGYGVPRRGGTAAWRRLKAGKGAHGGGSDRACKKNPVILPLISGLHPGAKMPMGMAALPTQSSAAALAAARPQPQPTPPPSSRTPIALSIPFLAKLFPPAPDLVRNIPTVPGTPPGGGNAPGQPHVYADWLKALPPNQPLSCIMGGRGCITTGMSGFGDDSTSSAFGLTSANPNAGLIWGGLALLGFGFFMIAQSKKR